MVGTVTSFYVCTVLYLPVVVVLDYISSRPLTLTLSGMPFVHRTTSHRQPRKTRDDRSNTTFLYLYMRNIIRRGYKVQMSV